MLKREDNAVLTRVGPGTPMGELMRRYWVPGLLSSELPDPDGLAVRVRLLGEDLVAFRDTGGAVGVLQRHCPHRGAPLHFGRNEEGGLRCVYHGWKFDVTGRCLDMPSEPPESSFKDKVTAKAYPAVERNGVVWVYMGAEAERPPLPELEWNLVPGEQVYLTKRWQRCNYAQAMEGEIDSSHSAFLHTRLGDDPGFSAGRGTVQRSRGEVYRTRDKNPRFEALDTDYGVVIGARYTAEEDSYYWRITQFLMPFHTIIPPYGDDPWISGHAWVPMDDENTMALCFTYHPTRRLSEDHLETLRGGVDGLEGLHPTVSSFWQQPRVPGDECWLPRYQRENDYEVDWMAQRTTRFSGLPGIWPQDGAMQEGMGAIYDRTQEHLGTSDTGIIRVRRRLIRAAKALRDRGVAPPAVSEPQQYYIRSAGVLAPKDGSWINESEEHRRARHGVNYAAV